MLKYNYGWFVHDIVQLNREWCPICAKQRWHEQYEQWKMCLWCAEKTFPKEPVFQIERFIKETF